MHSRGFTLVEVLVAMGLVALLAAVSWPVMQERAMAARRADATLALERVQIAQERHRALHGIYTTDGRALGISMRSPEGLYELSLSSGPDERFAAVARPLAGGPQSSDTQCAEITLAVVQGFATTGPDRRCWNR